MEPFYTDYQNDYPDDRMENERIDLDPAPEIPSEFENSCTMRILEGVASILDGILDALDMKPGNNWFNGGP